MPQLPNTFLRYFKTSQIDVCLLCFYNISLFPLHLWLSFLRLSGAKSFLDLVSPFPKTYFHLIFALVPSPFLANNLDKSFLFVSQLINMLVAENEEKWRTNLRCLILPKMNKFCCLILPKWTSLDVKDFN